MFLGPKTPFRAWRKSLHRRWFFLLKRLQTLQSIARKVALDPLAHEVTQHVRRNRVEFDARITTTPIRAPGRSLVFVGRNVKRADSAPARIASQRWASVATFTASLAQMFFRPR
jgi:hypothetical protein